MHAEGADLAYLGAGPIEDLLQAHASRFAPALAARCRRDSAWREAMQSAIWPDDMDPATLEMLRDFLRPAPNQQLPPPVKKGKETRVKSTRGRGRRDR